MATPAAIVAQLSKDYTIADKLLQEYEYTKVSSLSQASSSKALNYWRTWVALDHYALIKQLCLNLVKMKVHTHACYLPTLLLLHQLSSLMLPGVCTLMGYSSTIPIVTHLIRAITSIVSSTLALSPSLFDTKVKTVIAHACSYSPASSSSSSSSAAPTTVTTGDHLSADEKRASILTVLVALMQNILRECAPEQLKLSEDDAAELIRSTILLIAGFPLTLPPSTEQDDGTRAEKPTLASSVFEYIKEDCILDKSEIVNACIEILFMVDTVHESAALLSRLVCYPLTSFPSSPSSSPASSSTPSPASALPVVRGVDIVLCVASECVVHLREDFPLKLASLHFLEQVWHCAGKYTNMGIFSLRQV